MAYQLLSGKEVADQILNILAHKIKTLRRPPVLAVVLVGNNPASQLYVKNKKHKAETIGMVSKSFVFDDNISEEDLLTQIETLNHDDAVDGILVQLPLPEYIDKNKVIAAISPKKDVDGFHPINMGKLAQGQPGLRPCTPHGIMRLLKHYHIELKGLNAVVVGASTIVGKPLALELILAGSTVTVCNSKTKDLKSHVNSADVLISATGKKNLIDAEWIKPGAIIIDVGIHHENDKITGDLDFEKASQKACFITPVPGGVGPMTIAMLLENTVHAALS